MKNKKIVSMLLVTAGLVSLVSGSAKANGIKTDQKNDSSLSSSSEHEPITMMVIYQDVEGFRDLVHEKYPEINLQFEVYNGTNATEFLTESLYAGEATDIVLRTAYMPELEDLSDTLLDLSGYAFTDAYAEARIREVIDNGAIYLLPSFYTCFGITYNKTILDENGWTLPTSLEELEELAPKVEEAGYKLCLNQIQYPGSGFQYLCNIADTGYLSTLAGRKWQADFLSGKTTLADSKEMMECMELLQRWHDIGMLSGDGDQHDDVKTREAMMEGNTLFMIGSSNGIIEADTDDEFRLMPYLSEKGDQNTYILQTTRFYGLNKKLGEKENAQKLEDAVHVLEVLSTVEGTKLLMGESRIKSSLLPLKEYQIPEDNYYYSIKDDIDNGYTAPLLYSGWENAIVDIGNEMISFIQGKSTLKQLEQVFDAGQGAIVNDAPEVFTKVTEKIEQGDCARLIGTCFGEAVGADLALISENKYIREANNSNQNNDGISGFLVPHDVTEMTVSIICPTGWNGTIQTVTLTGKRVKELAEQGYDKYNIGITYPYVLAAPEGFSLDENAVYKVVICGASDEVKKEGNIEDSGIVGIEAAKEYFSQFEAFSAKDIAWKEISFDEASAGK